MRIYKFILKSALFQIIFIPFFLTCLFPIGYINAQNITSLSTGLLPPPGTLVTQSPRIEPVLTRGLTFYPNSPLQFDFYITSGQLQENAEEHQMEVSRNIDYFLTALTTPEEDFWVNLSPEERSRIIPDQFGQTQMGLDLLRLDYVLKQLTSTLISPSTELGKNFWNKIYAQVGNKENITIVQKELLHRVWVAPKKAVVFEHKNHVFIADAYLQVLLEEDYNTLEKNVLHSETQKTSVDRESTSTTQLMRTHIIPAIEEEVNYGENFALLRQIYHAIILAKWYKQKLHNSLLGQIYIDQNKILQADLKRPEAKVDIYNQYMEAFKKGVYDHIHEEYDPVAKEVIPHHYFSGGMDIFSSQVDPAFAMTNTWDDAVVGTFLKSVAGQTAERITFSFVPADSSAAQLSADAALTSTERIESLENHLPLFFSSNGNQTHDLDEQLFPSLNAIESSDLSDETSQFIILGRVINDSYRAQYATETSLLNAIAYYRHLSKEDRTKVTKELSTIGYSELGHWLALNNNLYTDELLPKFSKLFKREIPDGLQEYIEYHNEVIWVSRGLRVGMENVVPENAENNGTSEIASHLETLANNDDLMDVVFGARQAAVVQLPGDADAKTIEKVIARVFRGVRMTEGPAFELVNLGDGNYYAYNLYALQRAGIDLDIPQEIHHGEGLHSVIMHHYAQQRGVFYELLDEFDREKSEEARKIGRAVMLNAGKSRLSTKTRGTLFRSQLRKSKDFRPDLQKRLEAIAKAKKKVVAKIDQRREALKEEGGNTVDHEDEELVAAIQELAELLAQEETVNDELNQVIENVFDVLIETEIIDREHQVVHEDWEKLWVEKELVRAFISREDLKLDFTDIAEIKGAIETAHNDIIIRAVRPEEGETMLAKRIWTFGRTPVEQRQIATMERPYLFPRAEVAELEKDLIYNLRMDVLVVDDSYDEIRQMNAKAMEKMSQMYGVEYVHVDRTHYQKELEHYAHVITHDFEQGDLDPYILEQLAEVGVIEDGELNQDKLKKFFMSTVFLNISGVRNRQFLLLLGIRASMEHDDDAPPYAFAVTEEHFERMEQRRLEKRGEVLERLLTEINDLLGEDHPEVTTELEMYQALTPEVMARDDIQACLKRYFGYDTESAETGLMAIAMEQIIPFEDDIYRKDNPLGKLAQILDQRMFQWMGGKMGEGDVNMTMADIAIVDEDLEEDVFLANHAGQGRYLGKKLKDTLFPMMKDTIRGMRASPADKEQIIKELEKVLYVMPMDFNRNTDTNGHAQLIHYILSVVKFRDALQTVGQKKLVGKGAYGFSGKDTWPIFNRMLMMHVYAFATLMGPLRGEEPFWRTLNLDPVTLDLLTVAMGFIVGGQKRIGLERLYVIANQDSTETIAAAARVAYLLAKTTFEESVRDTYQSVWSRITEDAEGIELGVGELAPEKVYERQVALGRMYVEKAKTFRLNAEERKYLNEQQRLRALEIAELGRQRGMREKRLDKLYQQPQTLERDRKAAPIEQEIRDLDLIIAQYASAFLMYRAKNHPLNYQVKEDADYSPDGRVPDNYLYQVHKDDEHFVFTPVTPNIKIATVHSIIQATESQWEEVPDTEPIRIPIDQWKAGQPIEVEKGKFVSMLTRPVKNRETAIVPYVSVRSQKRYQKFASDEIERQMKADGRQMLIWERFVRKPMTLKASSLRRTNFEEYLKEMVVPGNLQESYTTRLKEDMGNGSGDNQGRYYESITPEDQIIIEAAANRQGKKDDEVTFDVLIGKGEYLGELVRQHLLSFHNGGRFLPDMNYVPFLFQPDSIDRNVVQEIAQAESRDRVREILRENFDEVEQLYNDGWSISDEEAGLVMNLVKAILIRAEAIENSATEATTGAEASTAKAQVEDGAQVATPVGGMDLTIFELEVQADQNMQNFPINAIPIELQKAEGFSFIINNNINIHFPSLINNLRH